MEQRLDACPQPDKEPLSVICQKRTGKHVPTPRRSRFLMRERALRHLPGKVGGDLEVLRERAAVLIVAPMRETGDMVTNFKGRDALALLDDVTRPVHTADRVRVANILDV